MTENSTVSAKTIANALGISLRKTETNIKKLRELNYIKRIGPAKGGYWQVKN